MVGRLVDSKRVLAEGSYGFQRKVPMMLHKGARAAGAARVGAASVKEAVLSS